MGIEILKILDIFAPPVKLNIMGLKSMKTKVGSFITICYFVALSLAAYYIFRTFFRTDSPSSTVESFHQPDYPEIKLRDSAIVPVIYGYLGNTESILAKDFDKYVTVQVVQQVWTSYTSNNGQAVTELTENLIPTGPCSDVNKKDKSVYDYYNTTYLHEMIDDYGICIHDHPSLAVSGKGSDEIFKILLIRLKPCILGPNCKPSNAISLLNFYLAVPQTSLDPGNLEKPFTRTVDADSLYYITPAISQKYNVRLKSNEVTDYRGFIPAWTTRAKFFDIKDTFFNVAARPTASTTCASADIKDIDKCPSYLEYIIQSSGHVMVVNRKYKTLSETFGELGGVNSVVFMVFLIGYLIYNIQIRKQVLLDQVYGGLIRAAKANRRSRDKIKKEGRNRFCCGKKTKDDQYIDELKNAAFKNIEESLDVINIVREMNNLRILTTYLLSDHHILLSPVLSVNMESTNGSASVLPLSQRAINDQNSMALRRGSGKHEAGALFNALNEINKGVQSTDLKFDPKRQEIDQLMYKQLKKYHPLLLPELTEREGNTVIEGSVPIPPLSNQMCSNPRNSTFPPIQKKNDIELNSNKTTPSETQVKPQIQFAMSKSKRLAPMKAALENRAEEYGAVKPDQDNVVDTGGLAQNLLKSLRDLNIK